VSIQAIHATAFLIFQLAARRVRLPPFLSKPDVFGSVVLFLSSACPVLVPGSILVDILASANPFGCGCSWASAAVIRLLSGVVHLPARVGVLFDTVSLFVDKFEFRFVRPLALPGVPGSRVFLFCAFEL